MNYVLVYESRVRFGPRAYSRGLFEAVVEELLGTAEVLPASPEGVVAINPSLSLMPVKQENPAAEYDPNLYQLAGPEFSIDLDGVTSSYSVVPLSLDQAKALLLGKIAAMRYEKEIAGTTAVIQTQTINLLTNREDRNLYLQAYQLMNDLDTKSWKFVPNTWLSLSKAELGLIVTTIVQHVQACYDWEEAKATEILSVNTSVADLASINLTDA